MTKCRRGNSRCPGGISSILSGWDSQYSLERLAEGGVGIVANGFCHGAAREAFDFQEPYLRHILGFIGLTRLRLFMPKTRLARRPLSLSQMVQNVLAESSLIKTSK
jgi:hypothetical protein